MIFFFPFKNETAGSDESIRPSLASWSVERSGRAYRYTAGCVPPVGSLEIDYSVKRVAWNWARAYPSRNPILHTENFLSFFLSFSSFLQSVDFFCFRRMTLYLLVESILFSFSAHLHEAAIEFTRRLTGKRSPLAMSSILFRLLLSWRHQGTKWPAWSDTLHNLRTSINGERMTQVSPHHHSWFTVFRIFSLVPG